MKLSATQTGRAGEYFVCELLERHGIEATRVDGMFDVLAVMPSGRKISVEVKTCGSPSRNRAQFCVGKGEPDVYAFVYYTVRLARFIPTSDVRMSGAKIYIRESQFTEERQADDIKMMVGL